ncbi:MAG: alpha amylase C-terminal domain-containing protein [Kiritimatiellia bacterium]|jgi:1,4-alpha-glucan branching enzyme|nr:alpha amylase C-terminal domain-containing protein [Kiritimatiellia bacterium]MDP6810724.1 alpha amylase C-terminal domain-containing protein [Kiritimatiellia bacterium]MDP7023289.1 alpha amylase C-terminal domain-containing protein [Kiritimatiellia bacterium]
MNACSNAPLSIIRQDPWLEPYSDCIQRRWNKVDEAAARLAADRDLSDHSLSYDYYGLHRTPTGWVFREWAPNATAIHLLGSCNEWSESDDFAMRRLNDRGDWELHLNADVLHHEDLYRLRIHWDGGSGDRIPTHARRVVQDASSNIFNAQVWAPSEPYQRRQPPPPRPTPLLIYEAHVGMAQEWGRVGTYIEFREHILPRIKAAGYNAVQLMAIMEHPYYGSFGYHVSNFFAASSRFGTPDELAELVDAAHGMGLLVIMDIVHSHAVKNTVEGLGEFDGTTHQFFHAGGRGEHDAWDSRCFDYGKLDVQHFLLSNCRFWMEQYGFDGFRFDGVTSMLYLHHGLGTAFTDYGTYFDWAVDEDAWVYMALANRLIHEINPEAVTIAEDVSGMPGLAAPFEAGGCGFDFRLAMGVSDCWVRLLKEASDENWNMSAIWHELTNRRAEEKTIGYAESHDQALVGSKTLSFELMDASMYTHMGVNEANPQVDRGIALHKMIRLITLATSGEGYLNFMGNEFGHPEWIDFPRKGNDWSYHYARRQWSLRDNPELKYHTLGDFDAAMVAAIREDHVVGEYPPRLLHAHNDQKILVFERSGDLFIFNFHPNESYPDYAIEAPIGLYTVALDSDEARFGGFDRRASNQVHETVPLIGGNHLRHTLRLYLPARTALVLRKTGGPSEEQLVAMRNLLSSAR